MAGYGKGRSMAYSDYYVNNSDTPDDNSNPNIRPKQNNDERPTPPSEVVKQRRAALKRRLSKRKVSIS